MIPIVGRTGGYFNIHCSLRVEVISYNELGDFEEIELKVLKNLQGDPLSECPYKKDDEFIFKREKNPKGETLEGLTLD